MKYKFVITGIADGFQNDKILKAELMYWITQKISAKAVFVKVEEDK